MEICSLSSQAAITLLVLPGCPTDRGSHCPRNCTQTRIKVRALSPSHNLRILLAMVFLQLKSLLWTVIHHNHSWLPTLAFHNNFICCLSSRTLLFCHTLNMHAERFFPLILCPTFMAAFYVFCLLKWCQVPLVKYLQ